MAEKQPGTAVLAKIAKLTAVQRDLIEKLAACNAEIDALLEGKASIGDLLKRLETAFDGAWSMRYAKGTAGSYVWQFKIDVPQLKRLLKAMAPEEIEARMVRYLADDDPFLVRNRHPFRLFVSHVNTYAQASAAPADLELDAPAVADCKHRPACKSDQEHTRRRNAEMRS